MRNDGVRVVNRLKKIKIKDVIAVFIFLIALPFSFFVRKSRPNLWLICEYENEARDNAYWFFKYIRENHSSQDVVYAINYKSQDYKKVCEIGETVRYGGLKHWILYLAAKQNVSSQKGGKPNAAICYTLEVTTRILRNSRVFLQHGVIVSDLPYLHYEKSRMSLFVCSSWREKYFIEEKFGYSKEKIIDIGLCRFDNLLDAKTKDKQVLIIPTWREWLFSMSKNNFMKSRYFIKWNSLLQDEGFLEFIEEKGLEAVFFLHRNAQKYLSCFSSPCQNIVFASDKEYDAQDLIKSAAYMITDFSSVAADFAYCKKPISYYQFDYIDYRSMHQPKGYFSYESDGFGKVCYELKDLIRDVKKIVDNNFISEEKFLNRIDGFFTYVDSHNCLRTYEAIKKLNTVRIFEYEENDVK